MDLEKIKKAYEWDPSSGDYSKSDVSYERRMIKKRENRNLFLVILYIVILIISVYFLFDKVS